MPNSPPSNRLICEKSPYLLQHAHNPVDWYPWGEEAFHLAKTLDRPIFLSIGYATCHWCHVMAKESFANVEIAKLMNEAFVNIKVDREELPEVDGMYMDFAQALMASAGGWPLNLILTPDLKPVFAVTYLPPANCRGLIGMPQFIEHIQQLWKSEEKGQLLQQADDLVNMFAQSMSGLGEELPSLFSFDTVVEMLYELMDPIHGGFKGVPKFPMGYQSEFLLQLAKKRGDSRALFCVELTLNKMQSGGIYDHLGGGFSRYAVNESWTIPHFEKMLYDNALLASAYLEAWKYLKKERFRQVAEETLDYLLDEMYCPEGGFFSAEDADIEGSEGMYYTWTIPEVLQVLPPEEGKIFCQFYGITAEGNFDRRNVLHVSYSVEEFAEQQGIPLVELIPLLSRGRILLSKQRQMRACPLKDDKILTSWNGLAIDAFTKAGAALHNDRYQIAAIKTAEFLRTHLWNGRELLHRFREKEARFAGNLDDYAFLIKGVLSLFEAGQGSLWLEWAIELSNVLDQKFKVEGGAFYSSIENPSLIIRRCEFYDGSEPSGNGVHCENLLRLYQITQELRFLTQAEEILKAAKTHLERYPPGACYHLSALHRYLSLKAPTVVIALNAQGALENEIGKLLNQQFLPEIAIIWKREDDPILNRLLPSLVDKNPVDGQTALYICRQDRCEPPIVGLQQIQMALEHL